MTQRRGILATRGVGVVVVVLLAVVVSCATAGTAVAQFPPSPGALMSPLCGWNENGLSSCGGLGPHAPTGDKDLDRAVAICDAHPNHETNVIPLWPPYDPAYKECNHVLDRWMQSDTAHRIAEREAKEAADKTWLENYAKGLKP